MRRLSEALPTRDTPRGLVVTVKDSDFANGTLGRSATEGLARLAFVIDSLPGLRAVVEGHTNAAGTERESEDRAAAVRNALVSAGLPGTVVSSVGFGNSRPLASNATVSGRIVNRRVEIVISGDAIGTVPLWERTY